MADDGSVASFAFSLARENVNTKIGKQIFRRRKMLSMTQAELADRCGVCFQLVQKWECGGVRLMAEHIPFLASALSVSPGYFFE
jgi:transcriptional regulator with XRE-family HTH domain